MSNVRSCSIWPYYWHVWLTTPLVKLLPHNLSQSVIHRQLLGWWPELSHTLSLTFHPQALYVSSSLTRTGVWSGLGSQPTAQTAPGRLLEKERNQIRENRPKIRDKRQETKYSKKAIKDKRKVTQDKRTKTKNNGQKTRENRQETRDKWQDKRDNKQAANSGNCVFEKDWETWEILLQAFS